MNERVTVEVDSETLARARAAGVDLSEVLKRVVHRELPRISPDGHADADQWYRENKSAVDSYNKFIAENGLFSDGVRKF